MSSFHPDDYAYSLLIAPQPPISVITLIANTCTTVDAVNCRIPTTEFCHEGLEILAK
jgi:hypothetical protein